MEIWLEKNKEWTAIPKGYTQSVPVPSQSPFQLTKRTPHNRTPNTEKAPTTVGRFTANRFCSEDSTHCEITHPCTIRSESIRWSPRTRSVNANDRRRFKQTVGCRLAQAELAAGDKLLLRSQDRAARLSLSFCQLCTWNPYFCNRLWR